MVRNLVALFFLIITALSAWAQSGPATNFAPALGHQFTATITVGYYLTYNGTTAFEPTTGGITGYGPGFITLSWTTSVTCESQINYGPTAAYGSSVTSPTLETTHALTITGLPTDGSTIHYQIVCPSSTGILGESGDFAASTYGPTNLASLIYSGGHIGMANGDPFNPAAYYFDSGIPGDGVYNGEFNATFTENACKWAFSMNAAGTVGAYGGTPGVPGSCQWDLMGRFPGLTYRYSNFGYCNADLPPSMPITSGTWQTNYQNRLNTANAFWSDYSPFWEMDFAAEPLGNNAPAVPSPGGFPLFGSACLTASGNSPTWWLYPYQYATASLTPAPAMLMGINQFGWEYTSNWGGDPIASSGGGPGPTGGWGGQIGIFNPIIQSGDKVAFDFAIETIQNAIIAGTRFDSMNFEAHLLPLYMYSSVDMKYRLWDMRRLGITPVINEANISTAIGIFPGYNGFGSIGPDAPGVTVNDSPFAQLIAANCLNIFLYDMIRYGAVKDIGFWTNALNGGAVYNPELGIFRGNLKTIVYTQLTKLLQDVSPPALSAIPVVRRLGYYSSLPYAGTTSQIPTGSVFPAIGNGCSYTFACNGNYGTPGLITIPWTEYVYRTNNGGGSYGAVTTFSQTAWTIDIQFYPIGSTGGNIFEAVDASNNQLVLVNWNASNGNITVTAGTASPIVVGTISPNTYNALAITKNGTGFSFCLNGGTVFTTTATIASIANLEWLDNTGSGNLNQQANLTTIDVYASQSIVTGTAALQELSTFQHGQVYSYDAYLNWVVP